MAKINLHKALKIKNRLAGELVRLRSVALRENVRKETSKSIVDLCEVYASINDTMEKLAKIKTLLCQANVGIYSSLEMMAEAKSAIEFYKSLSTDDEDVEDYVRGALEPRVIKRKAYISQSEVDGNVASLQAEINRLQDDVDDYNAKTTIDWEWE